MKRIKSALVISICALTIFTSCKKTDTDSSDIEETVALSTQAAMTENFTADDNAALFETTAQTNLQGSDFTGTSTDRFITGCGQVTVTPAVGFPKTIVIDFGTGCSSQGIFRSGKINILLSDSLRKTGTTAVMTFDNYFINSYKREGTITYTNTSTPGTKSWSRVVVDGKITAPDGKFWTHNGTHNFVQTAGLNTPHNPLDDETTITGSGTVTNSSGKSRTTTIIIPLLRRANCANIVSGSKSIVGEKHTVLLDYGSGECDRIATISIDGGPVRTILLR